jgi:hypothetical protein
MWQFLIWLDKVLNYLTGGERHQTISARLGEAQLGQNKTACTVCRWLSKIDKDHCSKEYIKWLKR